MMKRDSLGVFRGFTGGLHTGADGQEKFFRLKVHVTPVRPDLNCEKIRCRGNVYATPKEFKGPGCSTGVFLVAGTNPFIPCDDALPCPRRWSGLFKGNDRFYFLSDGQFNFLGRPIVGNCVTRTYTRCSGNVYGRLAIFLSASRVHGFRLRSPRRLTAAQRCRFILEGKEIDV